MAGKKQWSAPKKARKAEGWTKARKIEEARRNTSKGQNVAPGTFNGHSIGGYSVKKHGEDAAKLAGLHTRSMSERREARRNAKKRGNRKPTEKEVAA